jgi:hypothetical protein
MQTAAATALEKTMNNAVKRLRKEKHAKGLPFMINTKELPGNECYLEYPDGRILLVILKTHSDRHFTPVRELSVAESQIIRLKYIAS